MWTLEIAANKAIIKVKMANIKKIGFVFENEFTISFIPILLKRITRIINPTISFKIYFMLFFILLF